MSKLKAKLKQKKKPTYDAAEVKPLTEKELNKLSREVILEMYRKQRFGKLKALQVEITDRTSDEKADLREVIIENAKKRLEDLEKKNVIFRVSKETQLAEVELFANEITGIEDKEGSIMKVLKLHQHKQQEENIFFGTLDKYVGRERQAKRLKNIIKSNVYVAKLMAFIRTSNPKAMDDINLAVNQGDYEKLKQAMVNADSSITEKRVDYVFGAALTGSTGKQEYTGNQTADALLNHVAKLRYIGHTYAMNKAAKDAGVSFWLVMRLGQTTLADLRCMDDRLQLHVKKLENKPTLTKKDIERIAFIKDVHKMRETYDAKVETKDLEATFREHLDQHLEKKFNDPKFKKRIGNVDKERLKAEIMLNAKLKDLKLYQIFDLTYGSDKERSRLFWHSLTRGGAIARRYAKIMFIDEDAKLKRAIAGYWSKRISNSAIWNFNANVKKWGLSELQKEMKALEKSAADLGEGKVGGLFKDADAYQIDANKKHLTSDEIYDRDMIVKKYQLLSKRASELMTKKALPIIDASKVLDKAQKFHPDFATKLVDEMDISDETLKAIYGKVPSKTGLKGSDVLGQFGKQAAELKTMQEVTRARFKGLADHIEQNVEDPFHKKMQGQLADIDEAKFKNKVTKKLDNIGTTSRVKKYGVKLVLPAILLGLQGHRVWTGNAKTGEAAWDLAEAGLGFVPVVGTALDFKAMWTARSLSGKKLSAKERVLSGIFFVVGGVADALTIVGGAGLGLRATIGGMKGTRRALQAGKTMGKLSDAGHIAKRGPLTGMGAWVAGKFNEAERLEGATRAAGEAKALEQANLIKKLNYELPPGKTIKGENLDVELVALKADSDNLANPKVMARINDIEELNRGMGAGKDYMKVFGEGVNVPTHKLSGMLSGSWMKVKEKWLKMKSYLLKTGVRPGAVADYEKAFAKVRKLEGDKADELKKIAELSGKRKLAESELQVLKTLKKTTDPNAQEYIKLTEQRSLILKNQKRIKKEKEALEKEKELLEKKVKDLKTEQTKHVDDLNNEPQMRAFHARYHSDETWENYQRLMKKGHTAKIKEISGEMNKTAGELSKLVRTTQLNKLEGAKEIGNLEKNHGLIQLTEDSLKVKNQKWLDQYKKANKTIGNTEGKIKAAQARLVKHNQELQQASAHRFNIRNEIEMKAESWIHRSDHLRRLGRAVQYAGIASGLVYFLSDYKYGAVEQAKVVGKVASTGKKAAGWAINKLYFENHSGRQSIDEYIEDKVHKLEQKKKFNGILAEAKKNGRSVEEILAANSNTIGAQEYIKKHGLAAKMAAWNAKHGGAVHSREIVRGDAAKKAGEKLAG